MCRCRTTQLRLPVRPSRCPTAGSVSAFVSFSADLQVIKKHKKINLTIISIIKIYTQPQPSGIRGYLTRGRSEIKLH